MALPAPAAAVSGADAQEAVAASISATSTTDAAPALATAPTDLVSLTQAEVSCNLPRGTLSHWGQTTIPQRGTGKQRSILVSLAEVQAEVARRRAITTICPHCEMPRNGLDLMPGGGRGIAAWCRLCQMTHQAEQRELRASRQALRQQVPTETPTETPTEQPAPPPAPATPAMPTDLVRMADADKHCGLRPGTCWRWAATEKIAVHHPLGVGGAHPPRLVSLSEVETLVAHNAEAAAARGPLRCPQCEEEKPGNAFTYPRGVARWSWCQDCREVAPKTNAGRPKKTATPPLPDAPAVVATPPAPPPLLLAPDYQRWRVVPGLTLAAERGETPIFTLETGPGVALALTVAEIQRLLLVAQTALQFVEGA